MRTWRRWQARRPTMEYAPQEQCAAPSCARPKTPEMPSEKTQGNNQNQPYRPTLGLRVLMRGIEWRENRRSNARQILGRTKKQRKYLGAFSWRRREPLVESNFARREFLSCSSRRVEAVSSCHQRRGVDCRVARSSWRGEGVSQTEVNGINF